MGSRGRGRENAGCPDPTNLVLVSMTYTIAVCTTFTLYYHSIGKQNGFYLNILLLLLFQCKMETAYICAPLL